jgi:hypothetical protein
MTQEEMKIEIRHFLDDSGKIRQYPSKRKQQIICMLYLAYKFDADKKYKESEINDILDQWATFNDRAMLRRDMINTRILGRKTDCSEYWVNSPVPTFESFKF